MIDRREFLLTGGVFAFGTPLSTFPAKAAPRGIMQTNNADVFWPGGARLAISISMQMEAGAQPESGAEIARRAPPGQNTSALFVCIIPLGAALAGKVLRLSLIHI